MKKPPDAWISAMRAGSFERAWTLADAAIAARDPATRDDPREPYHRRWIWDGRAFDGRDVVARCYHGLGDTIQYARFLPPLARRARSLTVEVQPRLLPLLEPLVPGARWVGFRPTHPIAHGEVDIGITELDHALRMRPDLPAVPYLQAAPAVLPAGTIALCNGAGDWDAERSLPADLLAPLSKLAPCVTLMPGPSALPVLNPEGCPLDMAATAALVAGVSLVVTVDTMIAHLAGALGRPVWLMLKAEPDWRWNPASRRSHWYPTARLYAQPRPDDWGSVVAAILADLKEERAHGPAIDPARPRLLGGVARQADDPRHQARAAGAARSA
ncbi:glycosyltransferase family 9 protein [Sphingomonas spermidinifaciens]|uniref:glycosyltransferase family 9 protein n=1 Tax=Sphingomonas spermidinifaciens TaxID=1141889 RepID=UPI001143C7E8|nr:glycosyltransferase family 9 protein [Sphingomonas spermidinifaciens]